jgi:hypothetical protein
VFPGRATVWKGDCRQACGPVADGALRVVGPEVANMRALQAKMGLKKGEENMTELVTLERLHEAQEDRIAVEERGARSTRANTDGDPHGRYFHGACSWKTPALHIQEQTSNHDENQKPRRSVRQTSKGQVLQRMFSAWHFGARRQDESVGVCVAQPCWEELGRTLVDPVVGTRPESPGWVVKTMSMCICDCHDCSPEERDEIVAYSVGNSRAVHQLQADTGYGYRLTAVRG